MPSSIQTAGDRLQALQVPCPQCGKPTTLAADNGWRPFCSERCKLMDLGAWATGRYTLAADEDPPAAPDQRPQ